MSPRAQMAIGEALVVLGFVAAWLVVREHSDLYALAATFLGAVGGQQIGQARARRRH